MSTVAAGVNIAVSTAELDKTVVSTVADMMTAVAKPCSLAAVARIVMKDKFAVVEAAARLSAVSTVNWSTAGAAADCTEIERTALVGRSRIASS